MSSVNLLSLNLSLSAFLYKVRAFEAFWPSVYTLTLAFLLRHIAIFVMTNLWKVIGLNPARDSDFHDLS